MSLHLDAKGKSLSGTTQNGTPATLAGAIQDELANLRDKTLEAISAALNAVGASAESGVVSAIAIGTTVSDLVESLSTDFNAVIEDRSGASLAVPSGDVPDAVKAADAAKLAADVTTAFGLGIEGLGAAVFLADPLVGALIIAEGATYYKSGSAAQIAAHTAQDLAYDAFGLSHTYSYPGLAYPVLPTATADGCPHFTTYDGLHFDFQGAGEFIAARSTQPGNNFQVQMRIEPEGSLDSAVSIITQIAVQVGKDRITFGVPQGPDAPRPDVVLVNFVAAAISQTNPVLTLDGGTVTEISTNEYRVALNTGEVVTVNPFGDGMGYSIALSPTDAPGAVQGFLGPDEGRANDFQLTDGTVLPQPLTQDQLYHQFANAWRVTDGNSLFDYGPGQTTATFTDTMYPREILTLADFSPDLVAKAAALAAAAGITDPTVAADAEFDYLSMGNPNYFTEDPVVAARNSTVPTPAVITQRVVPPPSIGLLPVNPQVAEATGATTPVSFIVNLTSAATTGTVVNYTVAAPSGTASGKDFLTAADFGGTLPSGSATIPAGQTQATITINVPNSAIGSAPDKWLMVAATSPGGNLVYSPTAQTEILNTPPAAATGFDGDQVSLAAYYPDIAPGSPLASGTATVNPDTITFPSLVALTTRAPHLVTANIENPSVALSGDTISFLYPPNAEGVTFANQDGPFNGIVFTDSNPHAGNILGATITGTNIIGLTASDLSFTPNSVAVNFAGKSLPTNAPGSLQLGVNFANQTPDVLIPVHA